MSVKLAFSDANDGTVNDTSIHGEDENELIWVYAEGHYQRWLMNRINGQCSLQDSIDFDLSEQEKQIDRDVATFERLLG